MSRHSDPGVEDLLRSLAPQVLGAVVRRYGHFDLAEDAVQEAMLAAVTRWGEWGVPRQPLGWLITVASRRLTDRLRAEGARRRREELDVARTPVPPPVPAVEEAPAGLVHGAAGLTLAEAVRGCGEVGPSADDDSLVLLFLCCHPELSPPSQIALTLRAVGGLTTAQIARAFLVPEATMAQRISRAKQRIRSTGSAFALHDEEEWDSRLRVVLRVLYLVFNEGYTASSGPDVDRPELAAEAIRLTRWLHRLLPEDGEVAGLLALMLLTDARQAARATDDGALVPLAQQDRRRWDQARLAEGVALVTDALSRTRLGPYQLQAAIAAVHDEAPRAEDTDWSEILALYDLLAHFDDSPMVTLNRAVALAMVRGPRAGLELLATLDGDGRLAGHHRLESVRAHLLEMAGEREAARQAYRRAARRTTSVPERRHLEERAARLAP